VKVFITKYALTSGVVEREANHETAINEKMVSCKEGEYTVCYHKPHWYTTREEADARVCQMIAAKIKSLKKSLAKMEALAETFAVRPMMENAT
jgi:hypothetical protein